MQQNAATTKLKAVVIQIIHQLTGIKASKRNQTQSGV